MTDEPEVPQLLLTEKGSLVFDGILVGKVADARLVLDLGWMAAAGLHITLRGDPEVDKKRGGVVLER